jgi:hypothetical protein
MSPRTQRIVGFVAFGLFAAFVLYLPHLDLGFLGWDVAVSDFKAREYAYVGIYLIALLGLNILTGYTGQI